MEDFLSFKQEHNTEVGNLQFSFLKICHKIVVLTDNILASKVFSHLVSIAFLAVDKYFFTDVPSYWAYLDASIC